MKEEWKDIVGFEGLYKVSTLGRVKSLRKNKIMNFTTRSGYNVLNLRKEGKRYSKQVHRLVAEAFIENPQNKPIVNHKDTNRKNNNVNNLEWCTQKENVLFSAYKMRHRKTISHTNTGEKYIYYRKSNNTYRIVIDGKEYKSRKTLSEAIKVRDTIINEVNNR